MPVFEEIEAFEPNLNAKPKKPVLKGNPQNLLFKQFTFSTSGAIRHQIKRRDTLSKRTDLPEPVNDIPNQTPEDRRRLMHKASLKLER